MAIDFEHIDFGAFVRCTIHTPAARVSGRVIDVKGRLCVQLETREGNKARHVNVPFAEAKTALATYLDDMVNMTVFTAGRTYEFRRTKKGKLLSRSAPNDLTLETEGNDRQKKRALEGVVPALVEAGVMNAAGQVYADKQEKFRQIDRFTELIADAIHSEKKLSVVDFGCGKSYLGFAVEHYCRTHGIDAYITGIDLKPDVIENCRRIAEKCKLIDMDFVCGDIADYALAEADVMIALHACDVATDYALFNAIRASVKYIFSVPCCQHELNATMTDDSLLSRYGIIRERTAALVTDAVRAALLESMGYRVQAIEYIDSDRSLKNIMLRATFADTPPAARAAAKTQAETLLRQFGAKQTLYEKLYGNT